MTKLTAGTKIKIEIKNDKILASFGNTTADCKEYIWTTPAGKYPRSGGVLAVDEKNNEYLIPVKKTVYQDTVNERDRLKKLREARVSLRLEHHEGDLFEMTNYALTSRVSRAGWNKIKPYMIFKDMRENGTIISGGNFYGWVIRRGHETEVKTILNIS